MAQDDPTGAQSITQSEGPLISASGEAIPTQADQFSTPHPSQAISNASTSQPVSELTSEASLPSEELGDEVQFVFCVPRRKKKKKRRRLNALDAVSETNKCPSTGSSGPGPSSSLPQAKEEVHRSSPDTSALVHSEATVEKGREVREKEMNMPMGPGLPVLQPSTSFEPYLPRIDQLKAANPTSSHVSQPPPFNHSLSSHSRTMPPPSLFQAQSELSRFPFDTAPADHGLGNKRKREEDSYYTTPYMSPYVPKPVSNPQPNESLRNSGSGSFGFMDLLEDPNIPTTVNGVPPPLPPHRPIIPGWQNFSWNSSVNTPPVSAQPLVASQTKPSKFNDAGADWHRKYQYGHPQNSSEDYQLHTTSCLSTVPSHRRISGQDMISPKSTPNHVLVSPDRLSTQQRTVLSTNRMPLTATPASMAQGTIPCSTTMSSLSITCPQSNTQVISPSTFPSPPPRPQTTVADLRRKPSLYKIPAWPAPSVSTQIPKAVNPAADVSQNQTLRMNDNRISEGANLRAPNGTPSSYEHGPPAPKRTAIPKNSPNLIIDIAQTSQETFPFAAVAARHNKPIQKVFDTFSAIIQLPLLRQAADGRRHGPLGTERMREYREAKRAMERAQKTEAKRREKQDSRLRDYDEARNRWEASRYRDV